MRQTTAMAMAKMSKVLLIMVEMYSNNNWINDLKRTHAEDVIRAMEAWFCAAGLPRCMRSNGGPQFKSSFSNWLASLGILQETSSPYHSSSNGLSEKAVQDVKNVIKRQMGRYDLDRLIAEFNCVD